MNQSKTKGLGRRLALLAALSALMAVAVAASASAEVFVSPEEPLAAEQEVTVFGTPINGEATHVAIALCDEAASPGTECDGPKAVIGLKSVEDLEEGIPLTVRKGPWFDWDFTLGMPQQQTTKTTCEGAAELEPCAVFVSHYKEEGGGKTPLMTADVVPVTFK